MQQAILAGAPSWSAEELICGDDRLSPAARLAIYAGGYRARLLETLRGDYPVLRAFAGDTAFDLFAQDYIASHPSRAPSLYDFGSLLPDHLIDACPSNDPTSPLAILGELARLERARTEVSRARGIEGQAVGIGADAALLPGTRLKRPDSVHLLRLRFDLLPLVVAADAGAVLPMPAPGDYLVAVGRAHYRVRLHALEPAGYAFLQALGSEGEEVHAAAAAATAGAKAGAGSLLAWLALWLPSAAEAGLVTAA